MILSLPKRRNEAERTIGKLFLVMVDDLADTTFAQAMQMIVDTMLQTVREHLGLSDEQLLPFLPDISTTIYLPANGSSFKPQLLLNAFSPTDTCHMRCLGRIECRKFEL